MSEFKWATVTAASPLRVKLDGDTVALPFEPDSLVDPLTLVSGNRVRVELSNNRLVVLGAAGGSPPSAHTHTGVQVTAATDAARGTVELATSVEAQTGTDATRAVTPAGLASVTATETRDGLIEIATAAEVTAHIDLLRAVTPGRMVNHNGVSTAVFSGLLADVSVAPGAVVNTSVTFPAGRFTVAPAVVAGVIGDARDTTTNVDLITTTGFTLRRGSNSVASRTIGATWIAMQN